MSFCDYIFDTHNVIYSDWVSGPMEWNISSVYEDKESVSDIDFFTTYLEYTADVYGYDVTDFVTWSLKSFAYAYDTDFSNYVKNELGYNVKSYVYIALYYEPVNDDTADVLLKFTEEFVTDIVVDTYQTTVLTPAPVLTPVPTPVQSFVPTIQPSAVPTAAVFPSAIPDASEDVPVISEDVPVVTAPASDVPVVTFPAISQIPVTGQAVNISDINSHLTFINGSLSILIFLILFIWIEKKVKHIVKKFQGGAD